MARRVTPTFAPMQPLPSWRSTSGWAGEHPVYDPLAGQRRAPATDWPSADAADRAAAEGADHLLRQLSLSGQGLDAITSRGGQIRVAAGCVRSEERRVGNECVRTYR